ncbi:MAG: hypothetical protein JWQ53_632 [Klenkia sp.]|nr:hypothetical protein [Klenkia sp.]
MDDGRLPRVVLELLVTNHGLATRRGLLDLASPAAVDGWVRRRQLLRVFPHVYTARGNAATGDRRLHAALLCVGPGAALSHTTALAVRGLREHRGAVHVTIDHDRKHAGGPGLLVHRRRNFDVGTLEPVRGLAVTDLPTSLVDSWPLMAATERRPVLLDVLRRTDLDPRDVGRSLDRRGNVGGHRQLREALDLFADGVRSELEALGVLGVFRHRSLPRSRGQVPVPCPDGITRHLDRAWKEAMLAVELDGAAFHTSPEDRQADLRRDAVLASMGWLVLRFTYAEVLRDPEGVRARVLAVYRVRVAQLRAAG